MGKWRRFIAAAWKDGVASKLTAQSLIWIAGVIGLPTMVLAISETIRDKLWEALSALAVWMQAASRVPNWLLVILASVVLWQARSFAVVISSRFRPSSAPDKWRGYTSDTFDGIRWEWHLGEDGAPYSFRPLCQQCECEMQMSEVGHLAAPMTGAICDHCGNAVGPFNVPEDELRRRVRRLAERQLRQLGAPRSVSLYV